MPLSKKYIIQMWIMLIYLSNNLWFCLNNDWHKYIFLSYTSVVKWACVKDELKYVSTQLYTKSTCEQHLCGWVSSKKILKLRGNITCDVMYIENSK